MNVRFHFEDQVLSFGAVLITLIRFVRVVLLIRLSFAPLTDGIIISIVSFNDNTIEIGCFQAIKFREEWEKCSSCTQQNQKSDTL